MDYDSLRKNLGNTVRSERYRRGFRSQEALAYAAEMHPTYVGAIERGERNLSLHNLVRISNALEMPLSQLIAAAEQLAAPEAAGRED